MTISSAKSVTPGGSVAGGAGELASTIFPDRWARVASLTGRKGQEARRTLRRQAESEIILRPLRAAGASCGSCKFRGKHPHMRAQPTCDIHSDFHGYALTTLDRLCVQYAAKATAGETRNAEGAL